MNENQSNPQNEPHIKQCSVCHKVLCDKQKKFCSAKCRLATTNAKHQNYVAQQRRGLDRKTELMKSFGSKCEKCGYDKNYAALSFHHIDPTTKSFPLDIRHCSNRTWEGLCKEATKCQLLCLNCHAEHHHPRLNLDALSIESPALTN